MNKINYEREMEKILSQNKINNVRPKLLLHSCCAPCSTSCIERLKDYFVITAYFYNPNMDSESEYLRRAEEQKRLSEILGVECIVEEFEAKEFYDAVKGLEKESEGGKRCEECFKLRLAKTAEKAKELGFEYFTTTLTVSPLKNSQILNEIGLEVGLTVGVNFLPSDFKKKNGYIRSVELSKKYGLYRQDYCGCVYSKVQKNNAPL